MALTLFDPYPMYRLFGEFLGPVAIMKWSIGPLAVFAGLIVINDWYVMQAHIERVLFTLGFLGMFFLGMFTTNLLSKIMAGTAMARHGAASRQFGIRLKFGILLKFFTDRRPTNQLNLMERRAIYAIPLLTKLGIFALGIFIWAFERRSGTQLADLALAIGLGGFSSFLFTANPLFPADGYRWMAAYFERPNLRKDSLLVISMILRRRPLPSALSSRDLWIYVLFGLAVIIFSAVLIYMIVSALLIGLESQYDGLGIVFFCILLAMFGLFLVSLHQTRRATQEAKAQRRNRSEQWQLDDET